MTFDSLAKFPEDRRWRGQSQPVPVVLALMRRQPAGRAEFLLIKRNNPPYAGKWALVGGKWEFGERLEQVARREVKEETGLDADFIAWRGLINERVLPAAADGIGAHFLLFVCELQPAPDQEPSEQREGAVGWFNAGQIAHLQLTEAIIPSDYLIWQRFAGDGQRLPHFEVDMTADGYREATLSRFSARA